MAIVKTNQTVPGTPVQGTLRHGRSIHWPLLLWSGAAGGVGGLLGWLPGELVSPMGDGSVYVHAFLYFAVISAVLGATLGSLPGLFNRSRAQARRGALTGAVVAGLGGGLGALPAQWMFTTLGAGVFARAVGWAIAGAAIGLCPGVATVDPRRVGRGLLGGLAGGFVAGVLFEVVAGVLPHSVGDTGTSSRLVADIVVGLCIGLMLAVIETVAKNAWLTVLSGKREGAQFILSKETTSLGRDDRDDVLLWGDSHLALRHGRITRNRRGYVLESLTPQADTFVNGQPVSVPTPLESGDEITLGTTRLSFYTQGPDPDQGAAALAATAAPAREAPGTPPSARRRASTPGTVAPAHGEPASSPARDVAAAAGSGFVLAALGPGAHSYALPARAILTVGRDAGNDVVLSDDSVSARHAELRWEEGQWVVYDGGSTNGTYVSYGGAAREERGVTLRNALQDGSLVRFGQVRLRLRRDGA